MQSRINAEKNFTKSRNNLLAVVLFSLVNVVLTLFNAEISFLFSATFPMVSIGFGTALFEETGSNVFMIIGIIIALISIAFYGLCFLLSKKNKAFILVAFVFFVMDTLLLILFIVIAFDASILLDIVFHAWILYYLIIGVKASSDLKKMPPEEAQDAAALDLPQHTQTEAGRQSVALRPESEKGRVLLSQEFQNLSIVVKRAYGVTELIVNGMVYAEQTGVMETSYALEANVEGVSIKTTMSYTALMCLYINGNLMAKKRRLY